jgi:phytoene dehydrogenase-like protein
MPRVAIIGGGLAGLCCARTLGRAGVEWVMLESGDRPGGRVRTDTVEGFRLDRGFQVLLTAYREAGEVLDYEALALRPLVAGAMLFDGRGFARVPHPLRSPVAAAGFLLRQPRAALDALRIVPMAVAAMSAPVVAPGASVGTTRDLFRRLDLSPAFVDGFARAFFGGVFLDRTLETDASQFSFTFGNFVRGDAAVPARGMGEIPAQVARSLTGGVVRCGTPVAGYRRAGQGFEVATSGGERMAADAVVIATDMTTAHALDARVPEGAWQETTTLHYACALHDLPAPLHDGVLFLDGTGAGPVNHAVCLSSAAPEYAPPGQALVLLNLVGVDWSATSMSAVQGRTVAQMERWFGPRAMRGWRLLRTDRIVHALPRQHPADVRARPGTVLDDGVLLAGDHVTDGSIDGAMRSGRLAAEAALEWLSARAPRPASPRA